MLDLSAVEPLDQPGVADYHCHCDYSIDAVGSVDEYCQAALKRNLTELCFTTHFDIPKDRNNAEREGCCVKIGDKIVPTDVEAMEPYVESVLRAHETFFEFGLSVKLGFEFGWFRDCEETVLRLKEKYQPDYLLCGVHMVDGIFIEHCHEAMSPEAMAEIYFTDQLLAAKSSLFDTIAHLDYYRKIGESIYGDKVNELHRPYINDLFEALKASDTALEINTRSGKFGLTEYYPRMEIVNAARKQGVAVRYLGSDAHRPEDVGFDFELAVHIVPPYIPEDSG